MQIRTDYGEEPLRGDFRLLLLLAALSPFGLLMWTGLLMGVQRSLSAVWAMAGAG